MTVSLNRSDIPPEIRDKAQYLCWRFVIKPGSDKRTKVPYDPKAPTRNAKSNDPSTWEPSIKL